MYSQDHLMPVRMMSVPDTYRSWYMAGRSPRGYPAGAAADQYTGPIVNGLRHGLGVLNYQVQSTAIQSLRRRKLAAGCSMYAAIVQ